MTTIQRFCSVSTCYPITSTLLTLNKCYSSIGIMNEFGEPVTKYGDWLPRAHETVYVRDRRIWNEEMKKTRKKYNMEHREKFRQRLAEFTRMADAKMYRAELIKAQERERTRLLNIRRGALDAAILATKTRIRMEMERKRDLIRYDFQDQKRDAIREMFWEKPSLNWIIKENFDEKLNIQFIKDLLNEDNDSLAIQYSNEMYPGLPTAGEYDSMEGMLRHSDIYFGNRINTQFTHEQRLTSITKQPIPWYIRESDSKEEYIKENVPWLFKEYRNTSSELQSKNMLEYEKKDNSIVPNYWFKIDWDEEYEKRNDMKLDVSPIFAVRNDLLYYEMDIFADFRLMNNVKYCQLLKNAKGMKGREIVQVLRDIFDDDPEILPVDVRKESTNIEKYKNGFIDGILSDLLSDGEWRKYLRMKHKREWRLYKDFYDRMKHFREIHWKSSKMNFDSGLRKWRKEIMQWRYIVFNDREEHVQWRKRLRNENLSEYDLNLCRTAIIRFQQLQHLMLARRTGVQILNKLVNDLEDEVLKVFYIWMEDLCESGEEIAMGKGWSFNRYSEMDLLPMAHAKQVPIEYFKVPLTLNPWLRQQLQQENNSRKIKRAPPTIDKSH